jgi:hypothetical protein
MFWINAISTDGSLQERFFVFESFTIAQIIADKLEREGFITQISDQEFQAVAKIPKDPFRRFLGVQRTPVTRTRQELNAWTWEIGIKEPTKY